MGNKKSLEGKQGYKTNENLIQVKYNNNSRNKRTLKKIIRNGQRSKVIQVLQSSYLPLNMRQISILTFIERPTLCRRIAELMSANLIKIAKYGPLCP